MPIWKTLITAFVVLAFSQPGPARANGEGITVHGDWEITIRDRSGELLRTVTFSNDLLPTGARSLFGLLTGTHKVGRRADGAPAWDIGVGASIRLEVTECFELQGGTTGNDVFEISPSNATASPIENQTFPSSQSFTLERQLVVPEECIQPQIGSYSITRVDGVIGLENIDSGFPINGAIFSRRFLAADEIVRDIAAGQIVTIRVTYSFE